MRRVSLLLIGLLLVPSILFGALGSAGQRQMINLDGTWEIAEGKMDKIPKKFEYRVQVPGLVDMARPAFEEVGQESDKREAFWYRRTFKVKAGDPAVALLKLNKAKFGTQVYLNGKLVGEDMHCFTPSYFDVKEHLKTNGKENELIIRVGAWRDAVPKTVQWGYDTEKRTYHPGIYDSVNLILAGSPHIQNVQIVPDAIARTVRIVANVHSHDVLPSIDADYVVREAASGKVVAKGRTSVDTWDRYKLVTLDEVIPMKDCRLWTPEEPFLYELELTTAGDGVKETFGMRSFRFDTATGRAMLNGKPYYMRGSNVCIFRFFEDPAREGLPWDRKWVRALHRKFKSMGWNSLRYCIGFPPEFWYDIADEEGIMIQDEFPIWYGGGKRAKKWYPPECKPEHIAEEYKEWMEERWNHPCVVIWDAQNETIRPETGEALMMVRSLDLSNRPWDNGWSPPQHPDDCQETHPYLFSRLGRSKEKIPEAGPLSDKLTESLLPRNGPSRLNEIYNNAIIINEYAWIWLNRDGTTTTLTDGVYKNCFPEADTVEKRRYHYARWLAALTEYWRAQRMCAGVLHFCGLAYSRSEEPRGQTSDHFLDIEKLTFEPLFEEYVGDAFAPVGLMVNYWNSYVKDGVDEKAEIYVINDLQDEWNGDVKFRVERDGKALSESSKPCKIASCGREILSFDLKIPAKKGQYKIVAELEGADGEAVTSFRDVEVK